MFGTIKLYCIVLYVQVSRLESSLQQLQMNLASSHQRHKTEVLQLQDCVKGFELEIGEHRSVTNRLEHDIASHTNMLSRCQTDLHQSQDDVLTKTEEVGASESHSPHFNFFLITITFPRDLCYTRTRESIFTPVLSLVYLL